MKVAADARKGHEAYAAANAAANAHRGHDANAAANAHGGHDANAAANAHMGYEQRRLFHRRMIYDVGRSQPVLDLRSELRELGARQGHPLCYPLCDGLVLTANGVRHGLCAADGQYYENRPLYAWELKVGPSAADAEARIRLVLDAYGEGDHQWVYPAGRALEEREVDELAGFVKIGCFPIFSVFWAMRAAVRLGRRASRSQHAGVERDGGRLPLPRSSPVSSKAFHPSATEAPARA